jgi:serine/threonine protein kinase
VVLARHHHSGVHVAVKMIAVDEQMDDASKWSEVTALQSLRHPHVVRLFDVIRTPLHLCLVLEYLSGGELFDYLVTRHRLNERQATPFIRQVCPSRRRLEAAVGGVGGKREKMEDFVLLLLLLLLVFLFAWCFWVVFLCFVLVVLVVFLTDWLTD